MRWLILLLTSMTFWACSSNKKATTTPDTQVPERPQLTKLDSQSLAKQYYIEALQLRYQDKIDFATYLMSKAAGLDPENEFLTTQLAEFQMQLGQTADAIKTLQAQNLPLDSVSESTLLLLAHLNLELNQADTADIYYDALTKRDSTNGRYWWEWAQSLEESKNYSKLALVNEKLTEIMEYPESLIFRQLLLYSIAGQKERAPAFLEKAYESTKNIQWLTTALERYEEAKDKESSLRLIQKLIEIEPYQISYRLKEAQYLEPAQAGKKVWETWKSLTPKIQNDSNLNPVDADSILTQLNSFPADAARLLLYGQDFELAKIVTDTLQILAPDVPTTWALASGSALFNKDTVAATIHALKAWNLSKEEFRYAQIYIELLTKQEQYSTARNWLDSVRILNKDPLILNARFELDLTQGYHIENNFPGDSTQLDTLKAIRTQALAIADSLFNIPNKNIGGFPSDFLLQFRKGILLERLDSMNQAIVIFEKLIEEDPKNAAVLNYYGYSLVDKDLDIQKGAVLIERALAIKPKDPAYLDSRAWVLFKQKQYQAALDIFLEILPFSPQDPTALEHIGKTYEAMGNVEKTKEFKQKLLEVAPSHPWLQGTSE